MKLCMKAATGLLERWKKLKKISSCPIARALSISAKVSLAISIIAGLVYGLEADQMKKMKLKIAAMVAAIAAGVLQLLAGAKWSSCAQEVTPRFSLPRLSLPPLCSCRLKLTLSCSV
jgi:hypothetical protein